MLRSRVGVGLNSAAIAFAGLAIATVGPFAQSVVLPVVLGTPLAITGLVLGARRTGIFAMLSIACAVLIFLGNGMRGIEYVAIGAVVALASVAAFMRAAYSRAKKLDSPIRTL
jgi:hypothetical protein